MFSENVRVIRNQQGKEVIRKQCRPEHERQLMNQIRIYNLIKDIHGHDDFICGFIGNGVLQNGNFFIQLLHQPDAVDLNKVMLGSAPSSITDNFITGRNFLHTATHIIEAVRWLHRHGNVVHGDIKPANILIVPGNPPTARLIDFGFSIASTDSDSRLAGSPTYMPPELFTKFINKKKGQAVPVGVDEFKAYDLWALGLVLVLLIRRFTRISDPIVIQVADSIWNETLHHQIMSDEDGMWVKLTYVNNILQRVFPTHQLNLLVRNPHERFLRVNKKTTSQG